MLTLKILLALAALGLGIWLGMPGRYEQSLDEIERNMESGARQSRRAKRHFTPLAWMQRSLKARSERKAAPRRAFRMERPEDR